jgi:putative thioredoxin
MITQGEAAIAQGKADEAVSIFSHIIDLAPENIFALSGLIRALIAAGDQAAAAELLAQLPPEITATPAIERAIAALDMVMKGRSESDIAAIKAQIEANPDDHFLRYDLSAALMAAGDRDGAADALLMIIAVERDWNEGAARAQLLKLFDVVGISDPWVSAQRRRLSAALFT